MGECRIYNLPNKAYDGALRVPVEKAGETTGSIELSNVIGNTADLPNKLYEGDLRVAVSKNGESAGSIELSAIQSVRTINGITPDRNGNVNLGFEENELYKFQQIDSIDSLQNSDIRSGYCYYTLGSAVEGKPLVSMNQLYVAKNIYSFITAKQHTVQLPAGTYTVSMQTCNGGNSTGNPKTGRSSDIATNTGGRGISSTFNFSLTAASELSVAVGTNGTDGYNNISQKNDWLGKGQGSDGQIMYITGGGIDLSVIGGTGSWSQGTSWGTKTGEDGIDGYFSQSVGITNILSSYVNGAPNIVISKAS